MTNKITNEIIELYWDDIPIKKVYKFLEMTTKIKREKLISQYNLTEQEFNKLGQEFLLYWTEPNKRWTKLRWELEPTFEVNRRMIRFILNYKSKQKKQNTKITCI